LRLKDNPVFDEVAKRRRFCGRKNRDLRRKGIINIPPRDGDSVQAGKHAYYEYSCLQHCSSGYELRYQQHCRQAVTQLLHNRRTEAIKRSLENEMELASQLKGNPPRMNTISEISNSTASASGTHRRRRFF